MSLDTFSVEVQTHLPLIKALLKSSEMEELLKWNWKTNEQDNLQLTEKFIAKAKSLNLPARFWFANRRGYGSYLSILCYLFTRTNFQKSIKLLVAEGLSPWLGGIDKDKHTFLDPETITLQIFPYNGTEIALGHRKLALQTALAHLQDLPQPIALSFFEKLFYNYKLATARSSATSAGVMGVGDKNAKHCANLVVSEEALIREKLTVFAPNLKDSFEDMLEDAQKRLAAKKQKSEEAFDPEKLKKKLTAPQKDRLRTILHLVDNCVTDDESIGLLIDHTPWLKDQPQALCVNLKSAGSIARAVIHYHSLSGVKALDTLGSNIWLAAAQAGNGNAVLWVAEQISGHYREDEQREERLNDIYPYLCRLLAYGAVLEGVENPIDHAVQKAAEGLKSDKTHYYVDKINTHLLRLRSGIESIALDELLKGRSKTGASESRDEGTGDEGSGSEGEVATEEAPRRRSNRL